MSVIGDKRRFIRTDTNFARTLGNVVFVGVFSNTFNNYAIVYIWVLPAR